MRGSGVGGFGGGGGYHLGSGDALDALNAGGYHRERSGSDGDGEEDSPPTQHRAPPHLAHLTTGPGVPLGVPLGLGNPSNSLTIGQAAQLTQQQLHGSHHEYAGIGLPTPHHPHHMSSQSLRRSRNRPSAAQQQQAVHYQSPANVVGPAHSSNQSSSQVQENPYQQPYTGRGAGLSDSPTSENASDATLTDSELPFANTSALPLQNGGHLIGSNMDFSTNSARLNSLKRTLNSNGKSTTGIGHSNPNHDSHMDQYLMHTAGGKIYIPSDTPKNSTSDYKTSPSSSPSKKTSGSLLYKDGVSTLRGGDHNHRHLHHHHQRSKTDTDDDYLYKIKGFCSWKMATIVMGIFFLLSLVCSILIGTGAIPWRDGGDDGSSSAKNCGLDGVGSELMRTDDSLARQSTNGTFISGPHPTSRKSPSHPSTSLSAGVFTLVAFAHGMELSGGDYYNSLSSNGSVWGSFQPKPNHSASLGPINMNFSSSVLTPTSSSVLLHGRISSGNTTLRISRSPENSLLPNSDSSRAGSNDAPTSTDNHVVGSANKEDASELEKKELDNTVISSFASTFSNPSLSSSLLNEEESLGPTTGSLPSENGDQDLVELPFIWSPVDNPIHGDEDKVGLTHNTITFMEDGKRDNIVNTGLAQQMEKYSLLLGKKARGQESEGSEEKDENKKKEFERNFYQRFPSSLREGKSPEEPEAEKTSGAGSNRENNREGDGTSSYHYAPKTFSAAVTSSPSDEKINIVIMAPGEELHSGGQEVVALGLGIRDEEKTQPRKSQIGAEGEILSSTDNTMIDYTTITKARMNTSAVVNGRLKGSTSSSSKSAEDNTRNGMKSFSPINEQPPSSRRNDSFPDPSHFWETGDVIGNRSTPAPPPPINSLSVITQTTLNEKTGKGNGKMMMRTMIMGEKDGFSNDFHDEDRDEESSTNASLTNSESLKEDGNRINSNRLTQFSLADEEMMMMRTISTLGERKQNVPTYSPMDDGGGVDLNGPESGSPSLVDIIGNGKISLNKEEDDGRDSSSLSQSLHFIPSFHFTPVTDPTFSLENPTDEHVTGGTEPRTQKEQDLDEDRRNASLAVGVTPFIEQTANLAPQQDHVNSHWGGVCECYCPCLDKAGNLDDNYYDEETLDASTVTLSTSTEYGSGYVADPDTTTVAEDEDEKFVYGSSGFMEEDIIAASSGSGSGELGIAEDAIFIEQYFGSGSGSGSGDFAQIEVRSRSKTRSIRVDENVEDLEEANSIPIFPPLSSLPSQNGQKDSLEEPQLHHHHPHGSSYYHSVTNSSTQNDSTVPTSLISKYTCACPGFGMEQRFQTIGNATHFMLIFDNTNDSQGEDVGGIGRLSPLPGMNFPPDVSSFVQITIPSRLSYVISPYSYWNMQFYQSEGAYVTWEISVPRGASIGFYAKRNARPSHTNYDIVEILRGFKTRTTRSSPPSVSKEINKFLEQGHWFLSLYNDDSDSQEVVFASKISEEMTEGCPNGCSGNGQCQSGHCQCNAGFGGDDCSQSVCPVLCSGRGEYVNGECQCNPGWKGKECSLRHDECEVTDCNGHGKCTNGKCQCVRGYKGDFCEEVDCPHPTCSGHGFCLAGGTCMCRKGWRGSDCSQPDNEALQCLPDCSSHGVFNLETQTCTCTPRWTGEDCSQELCDTNCGPNGACIGGGCVCTSGWTGTLCNQRVCDKRCADHGQCKNGTCLCVTGWNGKHCTLEGCPNSCSGHGQCKANFEGLWECKCHQGWTGTECSVMMEQNCQDAKDNDKDGLTDCEDPECCSTPHCEKSQLCVSARKPTDILLRKQPPAITASFFEKMKFLIEEGSSQSYARQEAFNGSRSGVVRGHVVTPNGSGLMGVRVSSSSPLEPLGGFTLTQDDGWFDLMVNGGGAVTLHFGRSPFNSQTRTIFVPWNEVIIMDTVTMGAVEDRVLFFSQPCDTHDYEVMKPVVLATWKHGFQGNCPETSSILIESQVVQESIKIPGTGIHLMYHSSRVPGYQSTIQLQLTPETIPTALKRVHLRITIEGVLSEKTFEADPGIKFTYSWNRLNVFRQKVFGVTTAIVKVGYEYDNCANIIWEVQSTTLSGHDMSISDIGGWNMDIHHRYNFHEGIIQKGDGSNIYLKQRPRIIVTTMGNGYQRTLECGAECNGIATKQKLLAPVALAAAADGTLFVGDFNIIRRIMVDGTVQSIVKLNATRVSYRYHMALSPVDNTLYVSDPESHQIIRVRNIEDTSDPEHNWEPVVGSGERCLPGDEAHCGDEALARDAKLAYPKGVAVTSDNVVYFADGTNIRKVDRDGIITTVIGNHQQKSHWKPIPCEGTLKLEEVHLRWPTELAVNPLDNSLYIIDDHMILKLTGDNRIRIIAGRPFHCPIPAGGYDLDLATHTALISPQSIAFSSNGDLFVGESDSQRVNRVRKISTDGKVAHFAGIESKCNCLDRGCVCFEEDHYLATTAKFNTISAIAMSPDGVLHISDQGNYRIRSVMALIPQPTLIDSRQYEIYSPETQEIYIFNRFGQHVATKNIVTGETIYTFLYNVNMSNGKLSSVTDSQGNKIQILRDYSSQVKTIENAQGQKFNLRMSRVKMLQEFSSPEGYNFTFDYHSSTGLVKSRKDSSGRASVYSYDEFGRLTMAVSPTGQVVTLNFDLNEKGASVKIRRDQNQPETVLIKGTSTVYKRMGKSEEVTAVHADGNVVRLFPWSQQITTESVPYSILGEINPVLSDSFPVPGKQKTEVAGDLVNRAEWRYVARKEGRGKNKQIVQVDKKMRINGENILMVEYDRETKSELLFIDDRNEILNVTYDDKTGRPLRWSPTHGFAPVTLEYDRFWRLTGWKWADLQETYEYDRSGRLETIHYSDGTALTHAYKDAMVTLPMKITTAGGYDYLLEYDNAGAFQSLTTPRGHIHTFGISTSIGVYEYQYKAPSSRDIYKIQYNDLGQILSVLYPQNSGRVNYVYNKIGRLEASVAGLRSCRFSYQENTSLLKVAEVSQFSFEVKIEFKYHGGLVKEQREKYGTKTGLDNVHLKYQYDGNGRIANVEVEVNGKNSQSLSMKRNQNIGTLEGVADLTVFQNLNGKIFNRTVIQDPGKIFLRVGERDSVGRLHRGLISLKGSEVFKIEIQYDTKGKVKHRSLHIGRNAYADNVKYDKDGRVSEVMGSGEWKYVYDENGNAIQVMEQKEKSSLIYDSGDRVIQVGELLRYTYDARGFLVQRGNEKFQYDGKGLLIHAVKKDQYKVWMFYDHLDRLISWKDDRGNVTQFLYGNPEMPRKITHIHFPLTGKSMLLLWDEGNEVSGVAPCVVSVVTSDAQRYYIGSDQNGSPVAVFSVHGSVVKEVHRTPFGRLVRDTNPNFYFPIDFQGGILDRLTGVVIMNDGRPYDPSIGQWMTPNWLELPKLFKKPTDIFAYRYAQNDPITPRNRLAEGRMTELSSWLLLYGYNMNKIFGQVYLKPEVINPVIDLEGHLSPEFGAVSGLDCMANTVQAGFKNLGFSRRSKLNPEKIFNRELDLMTKIAYKRTAFGPGLLVSRTESGRTLVSTVDNSVVQGVVTSVLNGSLFIDYHSSHQNTYYFVKDNPHKLRDDMEELKRLGGLYNITVHDAENGIKELRLWSGDTAVSVRYGTEIEEETQRLLKHAHRRAIEKAWEQEKHYISLGLDGRRAWTEEEKDQLLSKGQVHGYRPSDMFSIHKFPQLADDPNNVLFQKDSRRKRRKSNKRHHSYTSISNSKNNSRFQVSSLSS